MAAGSNQHNGCHTTLVSASVVALAGAVARRGVARWEVRTLRGINGLSDTVHGPVWPVMQLGSLASVGIISGVAGRFGQQKRAVAILLGGGAAWLVCKPLKRLVLRPRPDPLSEKIRIRGDAQTGLGYPSGHAAVAAAMGTVLATDATGRQVCGIALLAGVVGASRVYVGAHYPLDVIGGWAVGLATGTIGRKLLQ